MSVRTWGVVIGDTTSISYLYREPDAAVAKARAEADARGIPCYVVKVVDTHYVKPVVCRCTATVEELDADAGLASQLRPVRSP